MDINKRKEKLPIIIDENCDYYINRNGNNFKLRYSKSDSWQGHVKGEKIASLKDNGNFVKINFNGKKLKFNYMELEQLYLLLKAKHKYENAVFNSRQK